MGTSLYMLTNSAKRDLISIAQYTKQKWGKEQAIKYADLIDKCFLKIVNCTDRSKRFLNDIPDLYVHKCEHHYIFYLRPKTNKKKPIIIAILHERMDLVERLKARLS